jgi:hypothetical protein
MVHRGADNDDVAVAIDTIRASLDLTRTSAPSLFFDHLDQHIKYK